LPLVETLSQRGQQTIHHLRASRRQLELTTWLSNRRQVALSFVLGAATLVGLSLLLGHWGFDDSYITYRYARNLLTDQGLVYNIGQRTLSTTTPFYAILLAGLGVIRVDLPLLSNVLSALALVLASGILAVWSSNRGQQATGMIVALLLVFSPLLLMTVGTEMCLCVLSILVGLYAYDRSSLAISAGALALAAMIRPDGVIAAMAVVIYHLALRRPFPRQPVLLYVGLVGIWYAALWFYYGSPIPVSVVAKMQQGQMAISTRFAAGFLGIVRIYGRQPLYWLHAVLIVVGIGAIVTKSRHWLPLMLWTVLYFLAYTLSGVSRYPWYYAPLIPAFVVSVAEGAIVAIRRLVLTRFPRPLVAGVTGLLLVALLAPLIQGVVSMVWRADPRLQVHREIGQWLQANTPPMATVGTLEVGIIGYYANRSMIGFAGLIQPEVADHLTSTSTYLGTATWAIQTYRPDYVVLRRDAFSELAARDWFQLAYAPVHDFTNQERLWLTAYQRSDRP
jgi:hypothetical protein